VLNYGDGKFEKLPCEPKFLLNTLIKSTVKGKTHDKDTDNHKRTSLSKNKASACTPMRRVGGEGGFSH
jgi:hypothetical protein